MRLPDEMVELAAGTEAARYTTTHLKYEPDTARVIATNGSVLAVVRVTPEPGDLPVLIPREVFIAARKLKRQNVGWPSIATDTPGEIHVGWRLRLAEGVDGKPLPPEWDGGAYSTFRVVSGTFPNYQAVIPALRAPAEPVVTFDADQLATLAHALTERGSTVHRVLRFFPPPTGDARDGAWTVQLVSKHADGLIGVVMPMRDAGAQFRPLAAPAPAASEPNPEVAA